MTSIGDPTDNLDKARFAIRNAHSGAAETYILLDIAESLRKLRGIALPVVGDTSEARYPDPDAPQCSCITPTSGFCIIHGAAAPDPVVGDLIMARVDEVREYCQRQIAHDHDVLLPSTLSNRAWACQSVLNILNGNIDEQLQEEADE